MDDYDLIDEDPLPEPDSSDLEQAYADGRSDALELAVGCIRACVRKLRQGGEMRHKDLLKLQRDVEALEAS